MFPGLDQDFPKEIIFASLNDAFPQSAVKEAENYKVAQNGRRAWMIAWWEFDGNEWFPQFRTSWHEKKYKKAVEFGVESVSLLGWKLSAIEHHVRYLAEFSWNPTLSAKDFYRHFVERIYGQAGAEQIASLYEVYDAWEARTPPATPADDRPMLLGAGWCSLVFPDLPFAKSALSGDKRKHVVLRAGKIIEWQQQLLETDLKSIAVLRSILPSLTPAGQSWAKLLINRLEFRTIYLRAVQTSNRAFMTYDEVASARGLLAGAKAAQQETATALRLAAQAIEKYAEEVRNRGDLGLIGQLNVQFYDVIAQLDSRFQSDSPYLTLDWKALRMIVRHRSDLTNSNCWPARDGVAELTPFIDQGSPAIRLALAGTPGAKLGSRFIRDDAIDLEREPLMDFYLRTATEEPVALMFQSEGKDDWFELDVVGAQGYRHADSISPALEINDGKWHRVTWNLRKLVAERIDPNIKSIKNLIVGTWANPKKPVVVEFKNVCFGSLNQLDGVELDR